MPNRILVVEDEAKIARLLQLELTNAGYIVELAFDGADGLRSATQSLWDLILLDISLPIYNGFDLIKSIRSAHIETPIIVVSARSTTSDIVNGLDLGVQDYVTKPFHMEELLARIRACLRQQSGGTEVRPQQPTAFTIQETTLNLRTREVMQSGNKIDFSPKEFELLLYLIEHRGEILSREQIMKDVWGYGFLGNSNLVDVYIRYVRKKWLVPNLRIRTVRGVGYCLEVHEK
ncbi:response regulator transcription factor [Paenibacillus sp. GCM10027628]|uniref:response regulator transcription factor n=1 Tax=Paenibacillus sp. GCM10027628 TaxID=3273413 RepID=UPI0036424DA1